MTERNRRRSPRFDVDGVRGSFRFNLHVAVVNMSVTGMAVETLSRLNVGRQYHFKLSNGGLEVELPGTVAWCVLGKTRKDEGGNVHPVYRAGIHFKGMLTGNAHELLHLIEENMVVETQQRVFGRFALSSPDALHVDSREDFTVRKLSASGMLVELGFTPEKDAVLPIELELDGKRVAGSGRVAFVEPLDGGDGDRCQVGLEFTELDDDGKQVLEGYIASMADTPPS